MLLVRSLLWLAMCGGSCAAEFPPFVARYCLDCHDRTVREGDLDLSRITDVASVRRDRSVWRVVYEKLESRQMPPPKQEPQPTEAERVAMLRWIADIAAQPDPALGMHDPGKPSLRRLTRLEYNNALRDLFGLKTDLFMFPERLPLVDPSYFQPATGRIDGPLVIAIREYGGKYPVLCPQLGLPGDHRAEHGYRNCGDAMDFSPLLLESYLTAAHEIVNSPRLPAASPVFAELLGLDAERLVAPTPQSPATPGANLPAAALTASFAPALTNVVEAPNCQMTLREFRAALTQAFADGHGGVFDVPTALLNRTIPGKGGMIRAAFGERALTINPNSDLWLVGFATAKEASEPALLTNKQKGAKVLELTFGIASDDDQEGVERLGVCVLGRSGEHGAVKLTAVLSDGTELSLISHLAAGEEGTTFFSFAAISGESIRKLIVDGSQFSGDYVLLDDFGIITNGRKQRVTPVAPSIDDGSSAARSGVASSAKKAGQATALPRVRLAGFMERAFRREVSNDEITRHFAIFEAAQREKHSHEDAMRRAVAAVLASPAFLFVEADGPSETSVAVDAPVVPLEGHELATRLSLFLWSSIPDDELWELAKAGQLKDPGVLERQARRMLRDPKSRELAESFATQWLRLDQLYTAKPDRDLHAEFYSGPQGKSTLHGDLLTEALLLFQTVQIEDRSVLDFLNADYTWLNRKLAKLYDLPLVEGDGATAADGTTTRELKTTGDGSLWRRVPLADARRGGYLTMAAPLVVTSLPFRTSPVKRGAWLLETIFNRPPTEPKIAFAIDNDTKEAAQQTSIRQKFEAHRSQAACYSCHIRLDPPGFALEHFSPIGRWRNVDGPQPIDARGEWSGQRFDGPVEFKRLLVEKPDEFTRGFIEHLLSYALGRRLELFDMPTVQEIGRQAAADGWKFSRVVVEIVQSYPFTHVRRTTE